MPFLEVQYYYCNYFGEEKHTKPHALQLAATSERERERIVNGNSRASWASTSTAAATRAKQSFASFSCERVCV